MRVCLGRPNVGCLLGDTVDIRVCPSRFKLGRANSSGGSETKVSGIDIMRDQSMWKTWEGYSVSVFTLLNSNEDQKHCL